MALPTFVDNPQVRELLGLSTFSPTRIRLDSRCATYEFSAQSHLFRLQLNVQTAGCIGVCEIEQGYAMIQHLAVFPAFWQQGIGTMMIDGAMMALGLHSVEVETDSDAVVFYHRLGFTIEPLGERYPGVVCSRENEENGLHHNADNPP